MKDNPKKKGRVVHQTEEEFKRVSDAIYNDEGWDTLLGRKRSFDGVGQLLMGCVGDGKITSSMVRKMKDGKK